MKAEKYQIWKKEEYGYKKAGKFIPNIRAFLHEDDKIHPAMLIVPGGAWTILTPSEANYPAQKFFDKGYNTFVLTYTNNVTLDTPVKMQALKDISRAVKFIRKHEVEFKINPKRVAACGFSAGGHLAASLAVHYKKAELNQADGYEKFSNRLDAAIVNYPLVSFYEYKIPLGYSTLLGADATDDEIRDITLNLHVSKDTSPMFLLHGMRDVLVPWQHSMLLAYACSDAGVACEAHMFCNGDHGLTNFGVTPESINDSVYVFEQLYEVINAMSDEEFKCYDKLYGGIHKGMNYNEFTKLMLEGAMMKLFITALNPTPETMSQVMNPPKRNDSVELWSDLADNWINLILS